MNTLVYVYIDQGIHKGKSKVAGNEKKLHMYSEVSISSRSLINIGSWDFLEIIKVEYILRVEIEEMSRLNKSRDYNKCRELEINSIH